ncbi:hypothetical protein DDZ13_10330 [Coraliomargarita sinensis]|uniref:Methyltransferase FkbM domain-containing protein n=1 Tax=Coraliomargarita sinensis TaxID=2174842 RepID=A0A317ZHH0_9BACT|nr:FkbM family methyltransferase [Coraliomargarita sinensis]PXA03683.1 hypothetical protein DDZ13_10330 [Coraliomargarita sinensis]
MKKLIAKTIRKKAPTLAAALRQFRIERRLNQPFLNHPSGFAFKGNAAMASGRFEPEETTLFCKLLTHCDRLVNVGANIGYYTCLAAHAKKPVLAFEPIPENARLLLENVYRNGWSDVEVFPLALGEKPEILPMFGTGTGASLVEGWAGIPSHDRRFLPVNTLDNTFGERKDLRNGRTLFWVDVEGFELSVLKGARSLIEGNAEAIWVVEICIDEHMPTGVNINPNLLDTFRIFFDNGFSACEAREGLPLVTHDDVEEIVAKQHNQLSTHNFAFLSNSFRNQMLSE